MNNKTKFLLPLFFFSVLISFGQIIRTSDNQYDIEINAARKLKKVQISTRIIVDSDKLKTIFIKVEMSSTSKEKKEFDVNKFILLDTVNKLKIRPVDISYQNATAYTGFEKLVKNPNSFDLKNSILKYDPSVPDSFENFNFDGFNTLEIPINFGNKNKPRAFILYFKPQNFKSKKIVFFFPFPKSINSGILYYGNEKIATLTF
ncbi:hypothetical protein [Confluentibacter sediminis]|uniref:hypothetical protein n=1 Tax=Confluentibacter sediminis TaxID=2219045 RepID=UPI000DABD8AD|nr:hypothetical protein [Confluentibacter sediminis]